MKRIAYAFALTPALVVSPALAQGPGAAPPPVPRPPAVAPAAPAPATRAPATPAPAPAAPPAATAPAAPPPAAIAPATTAPAAEATAPSSTPVTADPNGAAAPPVPPEPAPAEPVPAQTALEPAAAPVVNTPAEAPAAEPSSLELFGSIALTVAQGEPANPQLTNSFRRVGFYGEGGVAYRSKYFLDPFVSVGYATLASGDTTIPDTPDYGPGGTLHQHLGAWLIQPGVTSDLWRFRLRFGIGIAVIKQSLRYQGVNDMGTQLPLVWEAGLGFNFYKVPRFRLDAEARLVEAKGADVTFWMLGITGRGDVATF